VPNAAVGTVGQPAPVRNFHDEAGPVHLSQPAGECATPAHRTFRMNDRNLVRGLFLAAIALAFGLPSLRYPLGDFSRAGPGLFPLMVSGLLLVIAIATLIRSRFVEHVPLGFNAKNISIILGSLCGFALVSHFGNMIAGIVVMVFIASFAGTAKYSIVRNIGIATGLVLVGLAFQKLLGFNLPLY
jgi:hypothetical protein